MLVPPTVASSRKPIPVKRSSWLDRAYTLWAPFYDAAVASGFRDSRRKNLAALGDVSGQRVALVGVGTGLDIPWLKPGAAYVGIDLTAAMITRARAKAREYRLPIHLVRGDGMVLPFRDGSFDRVVLHLILAVVPHPTVLLAEAARVVRPGGTIHIFDKFLRTGQRALVRRWLSPLLGRLATRTDVVFEEVLASCPGLEVIRDEPDMARGWFRRIVLKRPR
jgi:ubiquinone/menaquinone biosynthesis C-methylase UbiE